MAVVHGGQQGRWFEELCRIKHETIETIVRKNRCGLAAGKLPKCGGVYAFWWTGDANLFRSKGCQRTWLLPGPKGRTVFLEIDDEWLALDTGLPIPLYVGKCADDLASRIGQHLRLGTAQLRVGRKRKHLDRGPTTSCQLRAGIENFFPGEPAPKELILANVGLSYVCLNGDEFAANRFYLEDLAIGQLRPPINVDVER